ncbi:MAG TPA: dienelactone hydrolase family protein [Flavisolibacter sp.]|nr:dienelactone hydrolase family protein [Flavisolibacter sp.]
MNVLKTSLVLFITGVFLCTACNNEAGENKETAETTKDSVTRDVKEEAVDYEWNGTTMKGYVAYDAAKAGKRPIVLIVPEWWGLTDYPRMRAKQLAELGYFAMAVDMYGDGKIAGNPDDALKSAMPFYKDPKEAQNRLEAALAKAKTFPLADTAQTAAIGYCFGGSMVLNAAKLGSPFNGVVSFHGGLEGVPADKNLLKANILVCHGEADNFVPQPQVDAFRKSLDSIGAAYTFKTYPNATHAFTNPEADKKAAEFNMPIKYNAAADSASWNDMKTFFAQIFR